MRVVPVLGLVLFGVASPAAAQTRVQGIDVSQFQGDMNWATAYNKGVRFAFIRGTRGPTTGSASVNDTKLHANVPAARSAGVLAGVYHYSRPDTIALVGSQPTDAVVRTSARDEASHFVSTAGAYMTAGHLRPVLDLEERGGADGDPAPGGGETTPLTPAKLSLWANAFLDEVQRLKGVEPLVYMNTNYATNFVDSTMTGRDLWVANWTTEGTTPVGSPGTGKWGSNGWSFWQFSSRDNGAGPSFGAQSTDLDLNVANGDMNYVRSFVIVPEPATLGSVAALGTLGLCARRRRQASHTRPRLALRNPASPQA